MEFQDRSEFGWGASNAGWADPERGLVIHYDGSDQNLAGRSHSACVSYWKATRRFHVGTRGWSDVGYSWAACVHGIVMEGRGLNRQQAAQRGANSTWYSCTLMSGPGEEPTDAQVNAVRELRAWLMGKGVGGAVRGHRDFNSTSCPGEIAYDLVQDGTFEEEGDMPLSKDDLKAIHDAVWETDDIPAPPGSATADTNTHWYARNVLRETYGRTVEIKGMLASLVGQGVPGVDEDAIVSGVLAGLTPERIAAAIPDEIAQRVVDELATRITPA